MADAVVRKVEIEFKTTVLQPISSKPYLSSKINPKLSKSNRLLGDFETI